MLTEPHRAAQLHSLRVPDHLTKLKTQPIPFAGLTCLASTIRQDQGAMSSAPHCYRLHGWGSIYARVWFLAPSRPGWLAWLWPALVWLLCYNSCVWFSCFYWDRLTWDRVWYELQMDGITFI
jgi:hypothetical protein